MTLCHDMKQTCKRHRRDVQVQLSLLHLDPLGQDGVVTLYLIHKFHDILTSLRSDGSRLLHAHHLASNTVEERHNSMHERDFGTVFRILAFAVCGAT